MGYFTFELVTPERVVLRQQTDQITLPTTEGEITVLPHHIPLVTLAGSGELRLKTGSDETVVAVHGGVLEVHGNTIRLLADEAERVEELDEAAIEAARQRAEDLKKQSLGNEQLYAEATAMLERSLSRLKIAKKYRGRHRPHTLDARP